MGTHGRVSARIGYAADADGFGVVYARVGAARPRILRAEFRIEPRSEDDRVAGFAAIDAIAPAIRKATAAVELAIDNGALVDDLSERRELPVSLLLPYVRARCALNAFNECRLVASGGANDLAARALAEVSMRVAA